ncbi:uncharacterized protein LOC116850906 [Odontomachus brunneus]|uniref:uncharacterized protein LOC116850906 n=1 Tax=Odontomachus brunneus TaxID=486640 RepID=UPI0013F257F9|nr:uncharacterized protein LOC116850906 [Odontomachus brunneus]
MGIDKIPNKVWKYAEEEMVKWACEICGRVWKGESWPEEWKEGIIVPVVKKETGDKVEEYKGITVMPSLYKIYAAVLAERQLRKKGDKIIVVFIDFKAAFDSVDRRELIRAMRGRGVRKGLILRVEMLWETKSRVKVEERVGEEFWMERGLGQGCSLSPDSI